MLLLHKIVSDEEKSLAVQAGDFLRLIGFDVQATSERGLLSNQVLYRIRWSGEDDLELNPWQDSVSSFSLIQYALQRAIKIANITC